MSDFETERDELFRKLGRAVLYSGELEFMLNSMLGFLMDERDLPRLRRKINGAPALAEVIVALIKAKHPGASNLDDYSELIREVPRLISERNAFAHVYYRGHLTLEAWSGKSSHELQLKSPRTGGVVDVDSDRLDYYMEHARDVLRRIQEEFPEDPNELREYLTIRS